MTNGLIPRSIWNFPTSAFPSFIDEIEEMLPTTIWPLATLQGLSVSEDNKHIYVETAVPGIDPKEVEVTFDKGVLTVRAEKKEDEKGKTYQRHATQSFFYKIKPSNVDVKIQPTATCKDGVMTVTFAKMPEMQPKKITVKTA